MKIKSEEEILRKAMEITAFEGMDKLTVSKLSEELGITKGSLYNWYPSKEDIIENMFKYGHGLLMKRNFHISLAGNPGDVLLSLISSWEKIFKSDETLPYIRLVLSLMWSDERAHEEYSRIRMMIESQSEVVLDAIGVKETFIGKMLKSHILMSLLSITDGFEFDCEKCVSDFMSILHAGEEGNSDD